MSQTFTPGPWEVHWTHDATGYPKFYIHGLSGEQKRDKPTLDANAHLIEAAPDLYEAGRTLRNVMSAVVMGFVMGRSKLGDHEAAINAAVDAMNAALQKAEGR